MARSAAARSASPRALAHSDRSPPRNWCARTSICSKILVRCAALHALAVRGAHQVVAEAAAPPGEPVGDLRCEVLRCKVLALGVLVLGVLGLEGIGCKDSGIARAEASEVRGMGYESGHRFFPSQQGAGVRG